MSRCQGRGTIDTYHIITDRFPPVPGGLEAWTQRFAQWLAAEGHRVFVFIYGDGADRAPLPGVRKVLLAEERRLWEGPTSGPQFNQDKARRESNRIITMVTLARMRAAMAEAPGGRHIVVSNYLTGAGIIGANIAAELQLPHIALTVGTDFARGIHSPSDRVIMADVLAGADLVITRNRTQARGLTAAFGHGNVRAVHTSLRGPFPDWHGRAPAPDAPLRLFSDSGFSSKKGTQVLLAAALAAHAAGLDVELTICGTVAGEEQAFWHAWMDEHAANPVVTFLPHQPLEAVWERCAAADLYCSATLSEGCSQARMAALCIGVPIISTLSGEMIDVATEADHVVLAPPADSAAFADALIGMCRRLRGGGIAIRREQVMAWRAHFSPEREHRDLKAALATLGAGRHRGTALAAM